MEWVWILVIASLPYWGLLVFAYILNPLINKFIEPPR